NAITEDNSPTIGGANDLELSGAMALGSSTKTFTANNAGATSFSGVISGSAAVGLTKAGSGTLTLSGNNTYDGPTTVSAGTLKLGASNRISNSSDLSVTSTFDMNGFDETVDGLSGAGSIINGGTLTVGVNNEAAPAFSGVVSSGSLTKTGSGTQTLTGANTYTGNTTINAGTLALSGSGSIANTPTISVASVATLDVTGRSDGTLNLGSAQTLKGNGTVVGVVSAGGTLAAGNSVGTLTNTDSLLLQSGGTNVVEVIDATNSPGVGYDL